VTNAYTAALDEAKRELAEQTKKLEETRIAIQARNEALRQLERDGSILSGEVARLKRLVDSLECAGGIDA
jgi:hypothetical protein